MEFSRSELKQFSDTQAHRQHLSICTSESNIAESFVYEPGVAGPRIDGILELASNENPYGASAAVSEILQQEKSHIHQYPVPHSESLRRAIANHWRCNESNILICPGTTSAIDLIARTALSPSAKAIIPDISFLAYSISIRTAGSSAIRSTMFDHSIYLDDIINRITHETAAIFIANPNNPTGTSFSDKEFSAFIKRVPDNVLVILDQAYAEYSGEPNLPIEHILQNPNLIILRSFSKAHGLAGLRIGYCVGSVPIIDQLRHKQAVFSVCGIAQKAALASLGDSSHISVSAAKNDLARRKLTAGLRSLGIVVPQSQANFVCAIFFHSISTLCTQLLQANIRVRDLTKWGMPNAIRITIGKITDIDYIIATIAKLI